MCVYSGKGAPESGGSIVIRDSLVQLYHSVSSWLTGDTNIAQVQSLTLNFIAVCFFMLFCHFKDKDNFI